MHAADFVLLNLNRCISSAGMDQGTTFYLAQGLF